MNMVSLNALILFDVIFIFFLFLVSLSCLLYYMPLVPSSSRRRRLESSSSPSSSDRTITMNLSLAPADITALLEAKRAADDPSASLLTSSSIPDFIEIEIESSSLTPDLIHAIQNDPVTHILAPEINRSSSGNLSPIETV